MPRTLASGRVLQSTRDLPAVSGMHALFLAEQGVTTVDAAVTDPNDISTASWSTINISSRTADTFTDTNDLGVPASHRIYQAILNAQTNHTAILIVEAKAGTINQCLISCGINYYVYVTNMTTGTLGGAGAGIYTTAINLGGGWWQYTIAYNVFPITGTLSIYTTVAGSITYAGDGTGSISVRNISLTQRNIATLTDVLQTSSAAAVVEPNNLAAAIWTKTNATNTTRDTIVTDVGVAAVYRVMQAAAPGCTAGRAVTVLWSVKAGTLTHAGLWDGVGAGISVVHTDGTVHADYGSNVTTPLGATGGGWFAFSTYSPSWSSTGPRFYACDAAGALTWNSAGGDTVGVTGISIFQSIALVQATAAARPLLTQDAYGPVIYTDGVDDRVQGSIAGLAQPYTVLICGKWAAAYAAIDYIIDGGAVNQMRFGRHAANSCVISSDGVNQIQALTTLATPTSTHTYGMIYSATASGIWQDGLVISNSGTTVGIANPTGFTIGTAGGGTLPANFYYYALAICDGKLSQSDMRAWYQWCKQKFGVA